MDLYDVGNAREVLHIGDEGLVASPVGASALGTGVAEGPLATSLAGGFLAFTDLGCGLGRGREARSLGLAYMGSGRCEPLLYVEIGERWELGG